MVIMIRGTLSKRRNGMPVSFSKNVKPMFREVDIKQMKIHGVLLDGFH